MVGNIITTTLLFMLVTSGAQAATAQIGASVKFVHRQKLIYGFSVSANVTNLVPFEVSDNGTYKIVVVL